MYRIWRPTPLVRARGLEKALGTKAHIYFKNESVSPVGSHKLNSAIPQAYYAKKQGITNITTETGAGQWGAALSLAARHFGLELAVYMVKVSYHQKPYRRSIMETYGAEVVASPVCRQKPDARLSLSIRIIKGRSVRRSPRLWNLPRLPPTVNIRLVRCLTM